MRRATAIVLAGMLLFAGNPVQIDAAEYDERDISEYIAEESIADAISTAEEEMVQAGNYYYGTEPAKNMATRSGRLDVRPLTKIEIANLYQNAQNSSTALSYDIQPHVGAPYEAGRASAANRQSTLNELNMYRQIAGLTPVEESAELSDQAQHGAVLLAAVNELTHYPSQPADMDDEFYEIGLGATSSSNLGAGYGRMEYGIDGCIQDNSGSNLTSVGHRRWFLNPQMRYIGMGQAESVSGYGYGRYFAYKVFDRSNDYLDHDFVSWPASGNFPVELLSVKQPWSISLNRMRYAYPSLEDIVVEITNPVGAVETFSATDNAGSTSGREKYFNVNNGGYGEGSCIICNFGSNYTDYTQPGVYQVKISGLKSAETGETVNIAYEINMFSTAKYAGKTAVTDEQYRSVEEFVERLYTTCLGRDSEEQGKLYWTMLLCDGDKSGAEAGYGFVFSEEYKSKNTTDDEFLDMLYAVYLGREADESGKEYWKDKLNTGISRTFVFRGFAESPEYTEICADYGIERGEVVLTEGRDLNEGATRFVYRIYEKALGRKAEVDGLNYWSGYIARKEMTPEHVAQQFFFSPEFEDKGYTNEEYIKILYRTFMGREYEDAGLQYWLEALDNGKTRDEVLAGFSGSDEFREIMASYGL